MRLRPRRRLVRPGGGGVRRRGEESTVSDFIVLFAIAVVVALFTRASGNPLGQKYFVSSEKYLLW